MRASVLIKRQQAVCAVCIALGVLLSVGTVSARAAGHGGTSAGRSEVPGAPQNLPSWSFRNYRTEGGRGPNLKDHTPVTVSCRVRGAKVQDGDIWWYRIASKPWSNRYYVSADDFYNDGRSTGSLKGTPFFDPKVPLC